MIIIRSIGILFFMIPFLLHAQNKDSDQVENNVRVAFGFNTGWNKDLNISPLNYKLRGYAVDGEYQRKNSSGGSIFETTIFGEWNKLRSKALSEVPTKYQAYDLTVGYLRAINKESTSSLKLFVGGQYHANLNVLNFADFLSWSYLNAQSLDLKLRGEYQFVENHFIHASMSVPVFCLLSVPAYSGFDEVFDESQLKAILGGSFTALNRYLAGNFELNYDYSISSKWTATLGYALRYQKVRDERTFINYENRFQAGISYKF